MPWGLRRFQETGQLHFLTFSCYKRRPSFANAPSRTTFETSLEQARQRYGLCVYGYVVMPEHIHMLVNEPEQGSLSSSHAVAQAVGRSDISLTSSRPVLAGAILRFQRMERAQVCREAPLHSPESGNARISCAS